MRNQSQGCCCWMRTLSWLCYNSNHLSLFSVRNQVCVAKVTSAKLPAMTKQWEPFCFIDCSSFGNNCKFVISLYLTYTGSHLPLRGHQAFDRKLQASICPPPRNDINKRGQILFKHTPLFNHVSFYTCKLCKQKCLLLVHKKRGEDREEVRNVKYALSEWVV